MELEICFICGVKIGRGNRSEVGSQEKMEKLVSVSNTVEHSSTIISDILSRILNETVMREESVCRICFNLLNDVDYHLKEAQEKTDEITNKFLDKEKDPLHYNPSKLMDPRTQESPKRIKRMFGKLVTTSGGRPGGRNTSTRTYRELSDGEEETTEYVTIEREKTESPIRGRGYVSPPPPRRAVTKDIQLAPVIVPYRYAVPSPNLDSEVGASSADEMTVNALAEKKRRLISRVLAPNKRSRAGVREEMEEVLEIYEEDVPVYDDELTIDTEKDRHEDLDREGERRRKKEKKRKKKEREKERKMRVLQEEREKRVREEVRRQDIVLRLSDESEEEEAKENTSPKKTKEIRTVDLSQLGDLFSQSPEKEDLATSQVVARKTVPTPAARKQMDFSSGQTYYILPSSYTSDVSYETSNTNAGEVVHHQLDPLHQSMVKQDQISLAIQEVSDGSDTEYSEQYHHVKPTFVPTTMQERTHVYLAPPASHQKPPPPTAAGTKPANIPNIACPHCDKKFMRGYNMRVHIDRVHNKNKPWQCQFCEKSFATTSDLKQHMSSHGMGKIHKCADCGRQFNNRDSAILHRKQHNNERTHVCLECGKGFFKSSCLTRHMRCHTGEKPFSCQFCERKFSQVTTLKHHKKVCKYVPSEHNIREAGYIEHKIEVDHKKLNITF